MLYSFGAQADDGAQPNGLIGDVSGNLYGTTGSGGANGEGTVFELTPNAAKTAWTEKVLYSFCAQGGAKCTDGEGPTTGLIMDASGNLYGMTEYGGFGFYDGTVFELTPNTAKTAWTEKVLHSFGSQADDGSRPEAGLIMGASGNLYGTTLEGGAHGTPFYPSPGTVFELTPNAAKTVWTEKVLYSFCGRCNGSTDGTFPAAGLIMDASGNLYGTTTSGGAHRSVQGGGTVFELTPNAAKTGWREEVLYSFCAHSRCTDGYQPEAGLIIDASGNLYGTTVFGGVHGEGTVFEMTPNAAKTAWTEEVLHSFCAREDCFDGWDPEAGVVMDASGNLYGTTPVGGGHGVGTVFELTVDAAKAAWTEEVLYSFCAHRDCAVGKEPEASLIMDALGNLYGTTTDGGAHRNGTVFELTP